MAHRTERTPRTPPLVAFRDVTLILDGQRVFEHTTWHLDLGEHWAVLGVNGSGKSTFLRAILGESAVIAGEIEYALDGPRAQPAADPPEGAIQCVSADQHRRLVTQAIDYHQARWSPYGEISPVTAGAVIFGANTGVLPKKSRAILALLGIEHLLPRHIGTLSNGEFRKVLLARALCAAPRVLVLDDPFAGLDHQSRGRLRRILEHLMKKGVTMVMATRRAEELPSGITRVLLVENQQVTFQGTLRAMKRGSRLAGILDDEFVPARRAKTVWATRHGRMKNETEPLFTVMRACVRYDELEVLKNVSWVVRPGENWVLRGPNGSGKSTLISLITADHPQAYANDIRIFGMQRGTGESIWEIKAPIGWMAPELQYHYDGDTRCADVVCSGLHDTVGLYRDGSAREAKAVRRWMRNLGIAHLARALFGTLSDGQQRLVLLARALVKEPSLLILDEPCQGLDVAHRHAVLKLIRKAALQRHMAVIYVTHHANEIPRVFSHELVLSQGRVVRRGPRQRQ